jgi:hypothetical protein
MIVKDSVTNELSQDMKYFVNSRNELIVEDCINSTKSSCDIKDFIMYLCNGLVEIKFIELGV